MSTDGSHSRRRQSGKKTSKMLTHSLIMHAHTQKAQSVTWYNWPTAGSGVLFSGCAKIWNNFGRSANTKCFTSVWLQNPTSCQCEQAVWFRVLCRCNRSTTTLIAANGKWSTNFLLPSRAVSRLATATTASFCLTLVHFLVVDGHWLIQYASTLTACNKMWSDQ